MKFPYGICDFRKITLNHYFYCDRTDRIPLLEKGEYLLFLRPRRFGKSLLLSMLANYYDVAKKHEFDAMFGKLKIGKNPTGLQNSYFILKWDFSCVDPAGSAENIRKALHDHINSSIEDFCMKYRDFLPEKVRLDRENALNSLGLLISLIRLTDHSVYLLTDEYDNFARRVIQNRQAPEEVRFFEENLYKILFKVVKASASESRIARIFITGVLPTGLDDVSSGFNIAENICMRHQFNDICGFTEDEIESVPEQIFPERNLKKSDIRKISEVIKTYCNGYKFNHNAKHCVYHPFLSLYFMDYLYQNGELPDKIHETDIIPGDAVSEYAAPIPALQAMLSEILKKNRSITISGLKHSFSIRDIITDENRDSAFMKSFLYYSGVLTVSGITEYGSMELKIPNRTIREFYTEKTGI